MADVIGFLVRGVCAFIAGHKAEEAARAGELAVTGNQGRSLDLLAALNEEINSHPDFIDSEHPVTVEAMSHSNVGIANAVAYTVSVGNFTDVIEHHASNTFDEEGEHFFEFGVDFDCKPSRSQRTIPVASRWVLKYTAISLFVCWLKRS
ncbi:uncharacterized protein RCC_07562 [Ramularia collo-cygni]|uniref:Uncharacterized protein n=1 Tax=Ramularia collo-cygni TaxID=112498 RepID=A0A2D3VA89_9PEZI|nr:uncharacterized protein RCC_07562 [Ramularia collo-cygni]CZT21697.1 uncharacterized protein RCC_07562 [Ramularia collo-cygni]